LKVLTDFDLTMTKFQGQKSSYRVFEDSHLLSEEYRKETLQLLEHYYPLEKDSTIPFDAKEKLMIEWWSKAHSLLSEETVFREHMLDEMVKDLDVKFREGCIDILELLEICQVPTVIVSAGVSNVLHSII